MPSIVPVVRQLCLQNVPIMGHPSSVMIDLHEGTFTIGGLRSKEDAAAIFRVLTGLDLRIDLIPVKEEVPPVAPGTSVPDVFPVESVVPDIEEFTADTSPLLQTETDMEAEEEEEPEPPKEVAPPEPPKVKHQEKWEAALQKIRGMTPETCALSTEELAKQQINLTKIYDRRMISEAEYVSLQKQLNACLDRIEPALTPEETKKVVETIKELKEVGVPVKPAEIIEEVKVLHDRAPSLPLPLPLEVAPSVAVELEGLDGKVYKVPSEVMRTGAQALSLSGIVSLLMRNGYTADETRTLSMQCKPRIPALKRASQFEERLNKAIVDFKG